jgi:hypothetical protein
VVHEAELPTARKGREYFTTISVGTQTCVSASSKAASAPTTAMRFESSAEFVLQKDGPTIARIALFRQGRLDGAFSNTLECWAEVDLADYFLNINGSAATSTTGSGSDTDASSSGRGRRDATGNLLDGWIPLLDPSDAQNVMGRVRVSAEASTLADLSRQVWDKLLPLADFNGDGRLEEGELGVLLQAFGSDLSEQELHAILTAANPDGQAGVGVEQLAALLAGSDSPLGTLARW